MIDNLLAKITPLTAFPQRTAYVDSDSYALAVETWLGEQKGLSAELDILVDELVIAIPQINAESSTIANNAQSASDSAASALLSKDTAALSESNANASKLASATSETNASASATSSQLRKWESEASTLTVDSYANEPEDIFVKEYTSNGDGNFTPTDTTKYSTTHWAAKAQTLATGQLTYMGVWDASGGMYPSSPALGHYYKISVAGTINTVDYKPKDTITFNGTDWDKGDNTEEVTSVAGKKGDVMLVKSDVGLNNVDNTSDLSKPLSDASIAALGGKLGLTAKAADSNKLDNLDSSQFLRSDVNDYLTAALIVPTANRDEGMFGTYESSKTQHIWSMGTGYRNSPSGANFGNLYGLAYKYNGAAGGHGVYLVQNGVATCGLGTNIWSSGNITAYSDERLKDNIEVIENALDRVSELRGVTYTRNDLEDKETRHVGVIAQEVQKVLPEAVTVGEDENKTLAVAYGNMVGLLIEAIKELYIRLEAVESN